MSEKYHLVSDSNKERNNGEEKRLVSTRNSRDDEKAKGRKKKR